MWWRASVSDVCLDERLLKMILIEIDLIKIEFEVK